MAQPVVVVDAFADSPWTGNPAAVCVLDTAAPDDWMQAVAREMNLSETAFLHPEGDGHRLRWFTPTVEVALCGHATLASAHVLWEAEHLAPASEARFFTRSGLLTARRDSPAGETPWITLDFPAKPVVACVPPVGLEAALGTAARWIGRNGTDLLVELADAATVAKLAPDLHALAAIDCRGVMVTARADQPEFDFVSRFFGPRVGVNEDPVTGSAHCALGPFWGERLGKRDLVARQVSARGGTVRVGLRGARVHLGGQAVTTMRGMLVA